MYIRVLNQLPGDLPLGQTDQTSGPGLAIPSPHTNTPDAEPAPLILEEKKYVFLISKNVSNCRKPLGKYMYLVIIIMMNYYYNPHKLRIFGKVCIALCIFCTLPAAGSFKKR